MYLSISMNNGTDNQKVLGNCPSCQRLMQIPVVTDVASVAKCPHCQKEVRVRDLLASAVPEAEIIAKDGDKGKNQESDYVADRQRVYDDNKPKTREKFEVPNQLYNGASRRNRKRKVRPKGSSSRSSSSRDSSRRRSSSNGSSENGQSRRPSSALDVSAKRPESNGTPKSASVAATTGAATASRSTPVSSPSPKRKSVPPSAAQNRRAPAPISSQRSSSSRSSSRRRSSEMDDDVEFGAAEIVKFLVGGLIAAPLAYLVLLWVVGVDPFGMASTFESVSPAIIPNSLRSESFDGESGSGFAPPTGESSSELFGTSTDDGGFGDDFEDDSLPLPSLDPDMVR